MALKNLEHGLRVLESVVPERNSGAHGSAAATVLVAAGLLAFVVTLFVLLGCGLVRAVLGFPVVLVPGGAVAVVGGVSGQGRFVRLRGVVGILIVLFGGLVGPRLHVVRVVLDAVPGEQSVQVFGVLEVLVHQVRRVGVGAHVLVEPQVVAQHIVDECAEQHDVGTRTNRNVFVRHRRGARETRIDVNDLGAARLASVTHWNPTGWHSAMLDP